MSISASESPDLRAALREKLGEAQALGLRQQYDEADRILSEILAADPDWAEALGLRGEIALKGANYQLAELCFRKAAGLYGVAPLRVTANLAHALYAQKRFSEAGLFYEQVLKQSPSSEEAQLKLVECLYAQKRNTRAMLCLQPLLARLGKRTDPVAFSAFHAAGSVSCELNRPQDAEMFFRRALEINPSAIWLLNKLGDVLEGLGCYRDARDLYLVSHQKHPDRIELLDRAGIIELLQPPGNSRLLSVSAELRGLPAFGGAIARLPPVETCRKLITVCLPPPMADRYKVMRMSANALAYGLLQAGYVAKLVEESLPCPEDADVFMILGAAIGKFQREQQRVIQVCPPLLSSIPFHRGLERFANKNCDAPLPRLTSTL